MSTRAYKITKIEYNTDASFNLSHDEIIHKLIPSVQEQFENNRDIITIGYQEIITAIQDFIKYAYTTELTADDKEYYTKLLAQMKDDAEADTYVEYYCF
jgi:hypothetical protein